MGLYLNGTAAYGLFRKECRLPYYVDKSQMLEELVAAFAAEEDNTEERALASVSKTPGDTGSETQGIKANPGYICITRPRRFGKSTMANMIASYFGKGTDSSRDFDSLKVSSFAWYQEHLNRHNVIHIMFNELPNEPYTYEKYIARIRRRLLSDLRRAYPEAEIGQDDAVWDALSNIYEYCGGEQFIFVLDEWDYIYHQTFATEQEKSYFTKFLSNLLKDKAYVELAYMTGILPIAKCSSGLELNMFCEYTMETEEKFSEYFGFTDAEVDALYEKFRRGKGANSAVTQEGLRLWYDGYHTKAGEQVYNPSSVVLALTNDNLDSYWTSSGPSACPQHGKPAVGL